MECFEVKERIQETLGFLALVTDLFHSWRLEIENFQFPKKARAGHIDFKVLLETKVSVWEEGRDTGSETIGICQGYGREHPMRECGTA